MKYTIVFYETKSGNCPVEKFLNALPVKHHAKIIRNLELLEEYGQFMQGGLISHIKDEIWELRTIFGGNISRILYFTPTGNKFVLLHGFIKKTPMKEFDLAKERKRDYNIS